MAKIDSFNSGFIVIAGKQYLYDVLILPDGTVKRGNQASWAATPLHGTTSQRSTKLWSAPLGLDR